MPYSKFEVESMTKKIIFLFLLSFMLLHSSQASYKVNIFSSDTSIHYTRMKEAALLKEFGANDTARALIVFWFSKRKMSAILSGVGFVIAGGSAANAVVMEKNSPSNHWTEAIEMAGMLLVAFMACIFGLAFITVFMTRPRKKLYRVLTDFRKTGVIPEKYLRKINHLLPKK